MPSSFAINAGDTDPMRVQIVDALGVPRDLSDLDAIKLYMMLRSQPVLGPKDCDFSEGGGFLSYAWAFGETATPGAYQVQFDLRQAIQSGANAYGDQAFSDTMPVTTGTVTFTGLIPLPVPMKLQFDIQSGSGSDLLFHVEGKDAWGDFVTDDVDGSAGTVVTNNFYSSVAVATMTSPSDESRTVTIEGASDFSTGGQGMVTAALRARAPSRGYLELIIQRAIPGVP